jgi:hypothetical protein
VKHAGEKALDALEPLLKAVRRHGDLQERRRGIFYKKGRAHLHFHEDPEGYFADLKSGDDWVRFDVTKKDGRTTLLRRLAEGDER